MSRWFSYCLVLLGCLIGLCGINHTWAHSNEHAFNRPHCQVSELVYGMCFNQHMAEAIQQSKSPAFQEQFDAVVNQAHAYLNTVKPNPRNVIITDLDETLIDNAGYYQHHPAFQPDAWNTWLKENQHQQYHQSVYRLLKDAKAKGFSVMFITGRSISQAGETLAQTKDFTWDGEFYRPSGEPLTARQLKSETRALLTRLGYHIVLNIGDQKSDLEHPDKLGHGEFLLPNILYNCD